MSSQLPSYCSSYSRLVSVVCSCEYGMMCNYMSSDKHTTRPTSLPRLQNSNKNYKKKRKGKKITLKESTRL